MGMAAILINGPRPFVKMFNPPLIEEKFEENWPMGFREEVVQRCGRTDDGQPTDRVITTAHPESLAQVTLTLSPEP